MPTASWRRARPQTSVPASDDAQAALTWLTPDMITTWAALQEAPPAVAQAVAQLLPFGSRAALEDLQIIACDEPPDEAGHCRLEVTPFGYAVMAAAAERSKQDPKGLSNWVERFDRAVEPTRPV